MVRNSATPAASTWGRGGYARDWMNPATARWWPRIHRVARRLAETVARERDRGGRRRRALDHAIDAAVNTQASDWLYMIGNGDPFAGYARERLERHMTEAHRWIDVAAGATPSRAEQRALDDGLSICAGVPSDVLRSAW